MGISILTHYLLEIAAAEVILCLEHGDPAVPSWVSERLREIPFVVVRRGLPTRNLIPVGIRGQERSQRWAAVCPSGAIRRILTPPDLLTDFETKSESCGWPAYRALQKLACGWQWLRHARWGPGGSVGFELATGKRTVTPHSDLDVVIYAHERFARSDARRLLACTSNLEAAVDVRVETPVCGFSLSEYAGPTAASIMLRTCAGPMLGDDPWNRDLLSLCPKIKDRPA